MTNHVTSISSEKNYGCVQTATKTPILSKIVAPGEESSVSRVLPGEVSPDSSAFPVSHGKLPGSFTYPNIGYFTRGRKKILVVQPQVNNLLIRKDIKTGDIETFVVLSVYKTTKGKNSELFTHMWLSRVINIDNNIYFDNESKFLLKLLCNGDWFLKKVKLKYNFTWVIDQIQINFIKKYIKSSTSNKK